MQAAADAESVIGSRWKAESYTSSRQNRRVFENGKTVGRLRPRSEFSYGMSSVLR